MQALLDGDQVGGPVDEQTGLQGGEQRFDGRHRRQHRLGREPGGQRLDAVVADRHRRCVLRRRNRHIAGGRVPHDPVDHAAAHQRGREPAGRVCLERGRPAIPAFEAGDQRRHGGVGRRTQAGDRVIGRIAVPAGDEVTDFGPTGDGCRGEVGEVVVEREHVGAGLVGRGVLGGAEPEGVVACDKGRRRIFAPAGQIEHPSDLHVRPHRDGVGRDRSRAARRVASARRIAEPLPVRLDHPRHRRQSRRPGSGPDAGPGLGSSSREPGPGPGPGSSRGHHEQPYDEPAVWYGREGDRTLAGRIARASDQGIGKGPVQMHTRSHGVGGADLGERLGEDEFAEVGHRRAARHGQDGEVRCEPGEGGRVVRVVGVNVGSADAERLDIDRNDQAITHRSPPGRCGTGTAARPRRVPPKTPPE